MSESEHEQQQADDQSEGISDDQLPEDLQPGEDNPLAEPLTEEEAPDDIDELDMQGGHTPEESDDDTEDDTGDDGESGRDDTGN